jgi:sugar lactone lactonase YvrE
MKPCLQWCCSLLFTLLSINAGAQEIVTIAGNGVSGFSGDGGPATNASLKNAQSFTFDTFGNLFIADGENNRIRKISVLDRRITTIAGTGVQGYSGDGGFANLAQINGPVGIAFDNNGNLYFSDLRNSVIRKIDKFGIITTFAGNGISGCAGDGISAILANLRAPYSLSFGKDDNLYFSDISCNCVRKIDNSGVITTIAGIKESPGYSGDGGPATNAKMVYPGHIAVDNRKNALYIPDYVNCRVRKVDLISSIITTFAGNGVPGLSGDGGQATLASFRTPNSVSVDSLGNVFICDNIGHNIRKVDTLGFISRLAGTGEAGYSPDGTIATDAKLNRPNFTVTDKWGNVYFCDTYNHLVRRINYNTTSVKEQPITHIKASIFPNPAHEYVTVKTESIAINELQLLDVTGCAVHSSVYKAHKGEIKLVITHLPTGIYLLKVNGQYAGKVVKE